MKKTTREMLDNEFRRFGIDSSQIAFYDSNRFLAAERKNPDFLENYALFVNTGSYDPDYLQRAKIEIPFITNLLTSELVKDGKIGQCVNGSMVLSRIFEIEGFWNYIVKGSLTIKFPKESRIDDKYFWSCDEGNHMAGHAWIVAPPFNVVDFSIKQQNYKESELAFLPENVCQLDLHPCNEDDVDLISPALLREMNDVGIRHNCRYHIRPNYQQYRKDFDVGLIKLDNRLILKYVPIGVGAPDASLQEIESLILCGKKGIEIYQDIIKPALSSLRKEKV